MVMRKDSQAGLGNIRMVAYVLENMSTDDLQLPVTGYNDSVALRLSQ
jgi:hypothetical protein